MIMARAMENPTNWNPNGIAKIPTPKYDFKMFNVVSSSPVFGNLGEVLA